MPLNVDSIVSGCVEEWVENVERYEGVGAGVWEKITSLSTQDPPKIHPRSTQDPPKIHPRCTQDPLKIHPRSNQDPRSNKKPKP